MRIIDADRFYNEQFARCYNSIPYVGTCAMNSSPLWKELDDAPTVDAEPIRHGEWIFGETMHHEWMKCSECLVSQTPTGCFTYCPNCGAKMCGEKKADATD